MTYILQVINYMIDLGYTKQQIKGWFGDIETRQSGLDDLLDILDVEYPIDTMFDRSEQVIYTGKWESALNIINIKRGVA